MARAKKPKAKSSSKAAAKPKATAKPKAKSKVSKSAAQKPMGKKPAPKKAATKKPAPKTAAAKKPAAKKPATKKPAGKQVNNPATKKAARSIATPTAESTSQSKGAASSKSAPIAAPTSKSQRAASSKSAPIAAPTSKSQRAASSKSPSIATPTSTQRAARSKAAPIAPPTFHVPVGPARQRLRDALAWTEDFVVECERLATEQGPLPWQHADTLELVGLERWGTQLAKSDREAGVCALVLAAQHGFPRVLESGGAELDSMGFRGDEVLDGASVESQLDRCARWVDAPTEENRQLVEHGFDPTRQLHTWDPDLLPHDAKSYFWYYELGQLASAAIVKADGDAESTSYYYWPAHVSVGRGLVVAVRGLRGEGADTAAIVRDIYTALHA